MVKVGFFVESLENSEINREILRIAKGNITILKNESVIIYDSSVNHFDKGIRSELGDLSLIGYSTKTNLEEVCFKEQIRIYYRYCKNPENILNNDLPSMVVSCVHHIDEASKTPKSALCLRMPTIGKDIEEVMVEIQEKLLKQALRTPKNFGLNYKTSTSDTTALFVGSDTSENFSVISMEDKGPQPEASDNEYQVPEVSNFDKLKNAVNSAKKSLTFRNQTQQSVITVKVMCNWTSSSQLLKDWNKMSQGDCTWTSKDKFKFVDSKEADYYVIINKPQPGEYYLPERTLVYRMEPYIELNRFYNDWYSPEDKHKFMYFMEHEHFRNNSEWWLGKAIEDLEKPPQKNYDKCISTVVSSYYNMKGHKLRVDFVKYFQANSSIELHVFGHDNAHGFKNYKGPLPIREKDNGILPYKYTFAAENSDINNYFTEKVLDALLGETLCFYWGCSNIDQFINPMSIIRLPLEDPAKSLAIVEAAIANDEWGKRIEYIREEKNKILHHFGFFSRTASLISINRDIDFIRVCLKNSEPLKVPGVQFKDISCVNAINLGEIKQSFRNFSMPMVTGEQIARLLAHHDLWNQAINKNRTMCIIEGNPNPNFCDHLATVVSMINTDIDWDVIFLNWTTTATPTNKALSEKRLYSSQLSHAWGYICSTITKMEKDGKMTDVLEIDSIGQSYIINPKGAAKLMESFNKFGFLMPLDLYFIGQISQGSISGVLSHANMVSPIEHQVEEKVHILRKYEENRLSNEILPPGKTFDGEVVLAPDADVKKMLEEQQKAQEAIGKPEIDFELIKREYASKDSEKLNYLEDLKRIISSTNSSLERNCFYRHLSFDLYDELYTKQLNLFWCGKQAISNICEIGFNAGHSTMLMLLGRDNTPVNYTIFDIGQHPYTRPCLEYIKSKFPHIKFKYVEGDSTVTMPALISFNPEIAGTYDVVHVDGGHTEHCIVNDMKNADKLVKIGGIVIVDVADNDYVNKYVDSYISTGKYREMNLLKTSGYVHRVIKKVAA